MQRSPNMLIVIMDDLGWGDLACHGNPHARTPNLDALHAQSTRLTGYRSGPLCTPARASLMTGRYSYRTRAIDTYLGRSMIDPDERTLAHVLRDAGYRTGIFGKWHLGDCYPMRAIDMGFDQALVHQGGGLRQPANQGNDSYFSPDLMHNGRLVPTQGYCTDIFTDACLAFIDEHCDAPWFAYLATNAPHTPLEAPDELIEPYRQMGLSESAARIYAMVENIDTNVGRLLRRLDELGLAHDTIVLYTSDHGAQGGGASLSDRYTAGLRGHKGSMYDGGVRVPCFWRWPGRFPPGADLSLPTGPIDVLPTLAHACAAKLPADRAVDGISLLPMLEGQLQPKNAAERTVFLQWHRGDAPQRYRNFATVRGRYKLTRPAPEAPDELFDLESDPAEQRNLADEQPALVQSLRREYEVWFDDVSSTRPDNYAPPRIVLGSDAEPATVLTWQDWRIYGNEEGWNEHHPGYWEIAFDRPGRYSFVVDLPGGYGLADAAVELSVAGQTVQRPTGGAASHEFVLDVVGAGPARVEALFLASGKRLGVRRVRVNRLAHR